MKIAVCIKQVPASENVRFDGTNIVRENTEMILNPADHNALTLAMEIKQTNDIVDIFSMGNYDAKNVLYTALALGANQAYLVTDRAYAGGDTLGTAKVLAKAITYAGSYDLIICGAISADGATGQVVSMLGQCLDIPSVCNIKNAEILELNKVAVTKNEGDEQWKLSVELPAVISVALGANKPVLPTLRNRMKAKKCDITCIGQEQLNIDPYEVGKLGAKSIVSGLEEREIYATECQICSSTKEGIQKLLDEINKAIVK